MASRIWSCQWQVHKGKHAADHHARSASGCAKQMSHYLTCQRSVVQVHESQCTLFASLAPGDKLMFWDTQATTIRKKGARYAFVVCLPFLLPGSVCSELWVLC